VKYLVYLARKSEKETKTLEKVLFTVLNIPPEQERRVERARKKSKFWKLFSMFRRKGTREDDDDDFTLDKDLNFTLNTEGDFS
jgi:hypothetical protein